MTVSKNGNTIKHFQAWARKYIDAMLYSNAEARSARRFVIESIQVNGRSEFMAKFEDACAQLKISLIVFPLNKPEYNGGVERGNRSFGEEFYNRKNLLEDSVQGMQAALTTSKLERTYPHAVYSN